MTTTVTDMHLKKGFTLIELLIGIAISSLIFVAASSLVVILFNVNAQNKRIGLFEQTKTDIERELVANTKWNTSVLITKNAGAPDFDTLQVGTDTYTVNTTTKRLLKNSVPLTPTTILIKKFTVNNLSVTPQIGSFEITVDIQSSAFTAVKDTIQFVVSQRSGSFSIVQ